MVMARIRNILLLGNVGKGKSTLANVLSGTNEFKESASRIRGTDKAKSKEFEHEGIWYRVIDTVGIGDSIKSTEEVLSELQDKADMIGEGLNRILFVTRGRFTKEEVEAFDLLSKAIFDDRVTDHTTIVCTDFQGFESPEACEKDRQTFQEEVAKLSVPLASIATIYVDNPPMKYKVVAEEARRLSRKILLDHLRTCEEDYQPELLAKFGKIVDEFNSVLTDTNRAIGDADRGFNHYINFLEGFISEREKVIETIEANKEKLREHMKDRFTSNTLGHTVLLSGKALMISGLWFPPALVPGAVMTVGGWLGVAGSESVAITKENESYKSFVESVLKDKEKCEKLESLQPELKASIEEFKGIRHRFKGSEYRKQNIDGKRIGVIKNVLNKILGEDIDVDVNLKQVEEIKHSTGIKAVRATLEAIGKSVPSPLSFYCIYRDHKEKESRTSLDDMESTIKIWRQDLKVLKEKELLLNKEYEKIRWCKEEMAKLLKE